MCKRMGRCMKRPKLLGKKKQNPQEKEQEVLNAP